MWGKKSEGDLKNTGATYRRKDNQKTKAKVTMTQVQGREYVEPPEVEEAREKPLLEHSEEQDSADAFPMKG